MIPALPAPGSREDELALKALTSDVDQLDVVKWMRSQSRSAEDEDGNGKSWVELDAKTHIAESKEDEGRATRPLTSQTLAGSKGLGVQRAFWNAETKELVAVVWIGTALSGWPTLAHGGAIVTIFEDCMSRMVAGPDAPIGTLMLALSHEQIQVANRHGRFCTTSDVHKRHLRQADLQHKLLRPPRKLLETESSAGCPTARPRSRASKVVAAVVEGLHEEGTAV